MSSANRSEAAEPEVRPPRPTPLAAPNRAGPSAELWIVRHASVTAAAAGHVRPGAGPVPVDRSLQFVSGALAPDLAVSGWTRPAGARLEKPELNCLRLRGAGRGGDELDDRCGRGGGSAEQLRQAAEIGLEHLEHPRRIERRRRVEERVEEHAVASEHDLLLGPVNARDAERLAREQLRREVAERRDHLRLDQLDLAPEVRLASLDLLVLGVAVG